MITLKVYNKNYQDVTRQRTWFVDVNGVLYYESVDADEPLQLAEEEFTYSVTLSDIDESESGTGKVISKQVETIPITKPKVDIYTDGCCLGNPGVGGYGVVILDNTKTECVKSLAEGFLVTTNNRMELMAAIKALEFLETPHEVFLHSDSQYLTNAFTKDWLSGWKKKNWKDVKNTDLWKRLLKAMEPHKVHFIWVKGHAGNQWNERCDDLAKAAADIPTENDTGYQK